LLWERQRDETWARPSVSVVRVLNADVLERLAATLARIASHGRELAAKRRAWPSRRRSARDLLTPSPALTGEGRGGGC